MGGGESREVLEGKEGRSRSHGDVGKEWEELGQGPRGSVPHVCRVVWLQLSMVKERAVCGNVRCWAVTGAGLCWERHCISAQQGLLKESLSGFFGKTGTHPPAISQYSGCKKVQTLSELFSSCMMARQKEAICGALTWLVRETLGHG